MLIIISCVWPVYSRRAKYGTFRIGQRDLFASPKAEIGPLELLRHQSVELQGGAETCANLREEEN